MCVMGCGVYVVVVVSFCGVDVGIVVCCGLLGCWLVVL